MQLPSIWAGYQELCILIASPFLRDSENLTHLFPLPHCARPARLQRALWLDFQLHSSVNHIYASAVSSENKEKHY